MAEKSGLRAAFDAQNALMESYALLNYEPSSTLADAMHSLDRNVKRIEALANDPTIPISLTHTLAAVAKDASRVKEELGKTVDDDRARFGELSDKFVSAVRSAGNTEAIININKEMLNLNLDIQRLSSLEERLPTRDSDAFRVIAQEATALIDAGRLVDMEIKSPALDDAVKKGFARFTAEIIDQAPTTIADAAREQLLRMDLIEKVAHNTINGDKELTEFNKGVQAVANENVDVYFCDQDMFQRVVVPIAEQLDKEIDPSIIESDDFCAEEVLGAAVAKAAEAHAAADLDYFQDEFSERAVTALDELNLGNLAKDTVEKSTKFSREGVDVNERFATGYVSIGEVVEAVGKLDDPDIDVASFTPQDYERIADGYAMGQQSVDQDPYDLAADVAYNAELVADDKEYGGADRVDLDSLMEAKSEESTALGGDVASRMEPGNER